MTAEKVNPTAGGQSILKDLIARIRLRASASAVAPWAMADRSPRQERPSYTGEHRNNVHVATDSHPVVRFAMADLRLQDSSTADRGWQAIQGRNFSA